MRKLKEIIADLDKNGYARDRLNKNFWKRSEELTNEFDTLMKELDELK